MSAIPVDDDAPLLALLAESALAIERLIAGERRRTSSSVRTSRRALLAIELRLKLEEQVLLPRLADLELPALDGASTQIEQLRELLAEAALGELALPNNRLLWSAIERMCTLHFDAVAQLMLLALADPSFDAEAARQQADDYRARWRAEIGQHGDIEDEEADPVGQPPR